MVVQIQTLAFFCVSLPPTLNYTMNHPSSKSLLLPHKHQLRHPPLPVNTPKMCTPWILRKLLVRRYAQGGHLDLSKSRTQLEEDSNRSVLSTTQPSNNYNHHQEHQHGQSNNAQPSSSSSRNNEPPSAPSRISVIKRGKHKRRVTIGSNQTSSSSSSLGDVEGGGKAEETDWPPFTDEDYIVFCFEEDGDFHVVTEENSKSQDCSEHGNSPRPFNQKSQGDEEGDSASPAYHNNGNRGGNRMNRRDCSLPNEAVEEELFYFSPRLQSDGIKSLTRFMAEADDEDEKIVKARSRVDEEMDYENIDGIKNRGQFNEEDMLCEDNLDLDLDLECPKTSMECRDGSVESTESSHLDWAQQLHLTKTNQEVGLSPSPQAQKDPSSSQNGNLENPSYTTEILLSNRMADDEESVYLSPKEGSQSDDEQSNSEESAETSDASQSEIGAVQLEEDEEAVLDLDSAKSDRSISSTSSFEFPVLQLEWTGSPVKWPKPDSLHMRKPKSRRVCLRCCRF